MSGSVFKKVAGKIVAISKNADNALHFDSRTIKNFETFKTLYKSAKSNLQIKASMYKPGGIKDPVRLAKDSADSDAYRLKELTSKIKSKYSTDEFSQARGKKQAKKAIDFIQGINDIFEGGKPEAQHFTKKQIAKRANGPMSKRDFFDLLDDKNFLKGSLRDDAANLAEKRERGGLGRQFLDYYKTRKRSAMRVMSEIKPQLDKPALIDRKVNARAGGVRFVRINGRVVPIRSKK